MKKIELNGKWDLREAGEKNIIPADVPGCVHLDLLKAKKIADPFFRDNEKHLSWINEKDWIYTREFSVNSGLLKHDRVLLECDGLDTLAQIRLNSKPVSRTDNMFRRWEFDIKNLLKTGKNKIEIYFSSVIPFTKKRQEKDFLFTGIGDHTITGYSWLRKEPCNFGWDWGPILITCGIWRDIRVIAFNKARLKDVLILQDHSAPGCVSLEIKINTETVFGEGLYCSVTLSYKNRTEADTEVPVKGGKAEADLKVKQPCLWWPNGMGSQPLYNVKIVLKSKDNKILDTMIKQIGLRTLRLERKKDKYGESFQFKANGVPFFAKGANWIPADVFIPRMSRADYRSLLKSAADVHMNMLRVWGGGIYENDRFYDLCDEMGICIYQDFIFANAVYPVSDPDFMQNVRMEAEDNIIRIRHHACLALWCGNNEIEQCLISMGEWNWRDYSKLFDRLLAGIVKKFDPQRDYWPSSPHTPGENRKDHNNPDRGDAHLWNVYHRQEPIEWYRTSTHRFCSEFGLQAYPHPETVKSFTIPEDRNITSYVMNCHQKATMGERKMMIYIVDNLRIPTEFNMTLWASQIIQGLGIKYGIEHWRRLMPRTMGTLYWQLNDCWPVASWASIDYFKRWKALHYMANHFYAPLLISGVEDKEKGSVEVHLTNDLSHKCTGELSWSLTDLKGKRLSGGKRSARIGANTSKHIHTLKVIEQIESVGKRNLLVWLYFSIKGKVVSSNLVTFTWPKYMELYDPEITIKSVSKIKDHFLVTLKTKKPALWAWFDLNKIDAEYSDNFFCLQPGKMKKVKVRPEKNMTVENFKKRLKIYSLYDTYT